MKKVNWSKVLAFTGAAVLAITLVAGLGGIGPAKATVIGTEDGNAINNLSPGNGFEGLLGHCRQRRGVFFNPFGYKDANGNALDTSDGIAFQGALWTFSGLGWVQLTDASGNLIPTLGTARHYTRLWQ